MTFQSNINRKFVFFVVFILISVKFYTLQCNPIYVTSSEKYHIVKRGENLSKISKKYSISVNDLKIYNSLASDKIFVGQKIYLIPNLKSKNEFVTRRKKPKSSFHIVKKGETIYRISKMYDLDIMDIMDFNNLESFEIHSGQKIFLVAKAETSIKKTKPQKQPTTKTIPTQKPSVENFHIVKKSETLYGISKKYSMTVDNLKSINNLSSNNLEIGQKLRLKKGSKLNNSTKKIVKTSIKKKKDVLKKQASVVASKVLRNDLFLPLKGKVLSEFGLRNNRPHKGIDIGAPSGEPIHAVLRGKVVFSGKQRGYGNVIVLEHADFVMTVYAHNEVNLVRLGDNVNKGQPISTVGKTGNATAPHLHFEYRKKGKAINPRQVLTGLD